MRFTKVGVIKMDPGWYVEHAGLGRQVQHEMEDRTASAVLPNLEMWLEKTNAGPYCIAPILSQDSWAQFEDSLPCYSGNGVYEVISSAKDVPPYSMVPSARL